MAEQMVQPGLTNIRHRSLIIVFNLLTLAAVTKAAEWFRVRYGTPLEIFETAFKLENPRRSSSKSRALATLAGK
jgi:hypothetical protein